MVDWTIISILTWTESYFKKHRIDSPRLTAEILLSHCLGIKRLDLYLQFDRPLQKDELLLYKSVIKRRILHEPVAYITGNKGFFESDFKVENSVLIPRPDTETLVETAVELLDNAKEDARPLNVLDLGTGSGAVIISLAKKNPDHFYYANDISLRALSVAKKNADELSPGNISFFAGTWFSSVKEAARFHLIVSNPPYIPTRDIQGLQPEIQQYEPVQALDGGKDGLDCYREILGNASQYLVPGGIILLEIGFDQKARIQSIAGQYPVYVSVDFIRDLAGHNRVAVIKKSID